MRVGRGVRKINEAITQEGRTLIITEEDTSKLKWDAIPDGSLHINPNDGTMSVKCKGNSDWIPAGIKNDGTISIAKDTILHEETFIIKEIKRNEKNQATELIYEDMAKHLRHTQYDTEYGYVFELEDGHYPVGRNCLEVTIDDVLRRTPQSGGVKEIDETHFAMNEELEVDQEITAHYYGVVRVGNPYPRFFESDTKPPEAEVGDFWIDYSADPLNKMTDAISETSTIHWDQILNKPTTLAGYGITDTVAYDGHKHTVQDVIGLEAAIKQSGGNAATVNYYEANANKPDTLCILDSNGQVPSANLASHKHTWTDITNRPNAFPAKGGNADTVAGYTANGNAPNTLAILDSAGNVPGNHLGAHYHKWLDITDRPTMLPANGGNADTVAGKTINDNAPNTIAILNGEGKLPGSHLGTHQHKASEITDLQSTFSSMFPTGMIMLWYGATGNIPKGWAICDGTNGTPDMRGRVPVGVSQSYTLGSSGGEATHILKKEELPNLGKGHISTVAPTSGSYSNGDGALFKKDGDVDAGVVRDLNPNNVGKNMTLDLSTGFSNKPIQNMQPYCALYYIMKL